MLPGIKDGDLLLVDTTDRVVHTFGVYVLEIGRVVWTGGVI